MTVTEARKAILSFTKIYFSNATVKFANQSFTVKPVKPLVNISFGNVTRTLNPPWTVIDGRPMSLYPTIMNVTIDLYTKGKKLELDTGMASVYENTAAEDLMLFASFLNSDYVIQKCHNMDLAIVVNDDVQDLTDLVNDTNYEYRARLELELRFTTVALGYSGYLTEDCIISETTTDEETGDEITTETVEPAVIETPSGGGGSEELLDGDELSDVEDSYFIDAEINEERMLNPVEKDSLIEVYITDEDGTVLTDEDGTWLFVKEDEI